MPQPPRRRSERPAGKSFTTSKNRKKRNAGMAIFHGASDDTVAVAATTARSCPATSSSTNSLGSRCL